MKRKYHIRQLNKAKGNLTWYGEISEYGARKRVNLGTTSEAEALAWKAKMEALEHLPEELRNNLEVQVATGMVKASKKHGSLELFVRYRSELSKLHKDSPSTMKAYDNRLVRAKALITSVPEIDKIDRSRCRAWVAELGSTLSPKTISEMVKVAKGFWKWAVECGFVKTNPLEGVPLPKRKKKERAFWTSDEVVKILESAPDDLNRAFWGVMALAGLRHEEAYSLTWGRVNLERKELRIMGKGSKIAMLPISTRLSELLQQIRPEKPSNQDLVFKGLSPYPTGRMRTLVRVCEDMSFEVHGDVTFHRFRHSFASNLLRAGVGIKPVQLLMRHEDAKITLDTYGHLLAGDLSQAVESL